MTAALKHLITLVWFTALFVVAGMYAFDYLQRTVEETKAEVFGRVDKTLNAPIEAVRDFGNNFEHSINQTLDDAGMWEDTVDFFSAAQDNLNWLVGGEEHMLEQREARRQECIRRYGSEYPDP